MRMFNWGKIVIYSFLSLVLATGICGINLNEPTPSSYIPQTQTCQKYVSNNSAHQSLFDALIQHQLELLLPSGYNTQIAARVNGQDYVSYINSVFYKRSYVKHNTAVPDFSTNNLIKHRKIEYTIFPFHSHT